MTRCSRLAAAALVVLAALALWAFAWEPDRLVTRTTTLDLPGWERPLRVAVLSDIHVGAPYIGLDKIEAMVDATNAAAPDLVLLAGDYVIHEVVGGEFIEPSELAPALSRLQPRLGTYAVLGNHDYWLDGPRVRAALEAGGVTVLEDEVARIDDFWLLGIGDLWTKRHDLAAVQALVPDDGAPALLLTHTPDIFPRVGERFALSVAGHTHGGQVRLPLVGATIVPSAFGQRFAAGHVVERGRHLFVSTGVGTSILPVRFGVPPEVTVLELR